MKFSALPILILLFVANCSTFGKITTTKDDFKKTTLIKVSLIHKTTETVQAGLFSMAYPAVFEYFREIDPKQNFNPAFVKIKFSGNPDDPDISKKAFLKIDEKNYDVVLSEISNTVLSGVQTSVGPGTAYGKTATGAIDYSKPNYGSQVVTTRSYNYKNLTATIVLTKEQEQAILQGKELFYRIYIGTSPYTFQVVAPKDLEIVKNFLNSKGD